MKRIWVLAVLLVVTVLVGGKCGPDVRIVEADVVIYDAASPGDVIAAGDPVGISVPLRNSGVARGAPVSIVVELLDKDGIVVDQDSVLVPEIAVWAEPVFDFAPFDTSSPAFVSLCGTGTFRVTYTVGTRAPVVWERTFKVQPTTPDTRIFENFAQGFDPFVVYPPGPTTGPRRELT